VKIRRNPSITEQQQNLLRVKLSKNIDPSYGQIANSVDWDQIDELFGETYCFRISSSVFLPIWNFDAVFLRVA
jgi:hypothetical protein